MANEKFIQPSDGIRIVAQAPEPRTLLTPEDMETARRRVAAGELIDEVAEDLAIEQVLLQQALGIK